MLNTTIKKTPLINLPLQNLSFTSGESMFKSTMLRLYINNSSTYLKFLFYYLTPESKLNNFYLTEYVNSRNVRLFSLNYNIDGLSLYFLNNDIILQKVLYSLMNKLLNFINQFSTYYYNAWYVNLFFIGVGYKVFIYNNFLYLRLGFSRMLKVLIPDGINILTRKRNHLRLFSSDLSKLSSFSHLLKNLRSFNKYKGKGIYQSNDFSNIKLKIGKKQQFF